MEDKLVDAQDTSTHTKEGYEKLHRCFYCHDLLPLKRMQKTGGCPTCGSRKVYETWLIKNDDEIALLDEWGYDYKANGFTIEREGNLPSTHQEYKDQKGP